MKFPSSERTVATPVTGSTWSTPLWGLGGGGINGQQLGSTTYTRPFGVTATPTGLIMSCGSSAATRWAPEVPLICMTPGRPLPSGADDTKKSPGGGACALAVGGAHKIAAM